ncbi:uncharacterized protein LOC143688454 [Tamandua tetradactyla]|uniref:uncharacterized protein LOC143688454 n=1 Tax=Tamandua tetradactyla TaxID=48850 RepID=UPI0040549C1A
MTRKQNLTMTFVLHVFHTVVQMISGKPPPYVTVLPNSSWKGGTYQLAVLSPVQCVELSCDVIVDPTVPGPGSSLGVIFHIAKETITPGCHVPGRGSAMVSFAELGLDRE